MRDDLLHALGTRAAELTDTQGELLEEAAGYDLDQVLRSIDETAEGNISLLIWRVNRLVKVGRLLPDAGEGERQASAKRLRSLENWCRVSLSQMPESDRRDALTAEFKWAGEPTIQAGLQIASEHE